MADTQITSPAQTCRPPVSIWGLPISPWTFDETLAEIDRLIASGLSGYFITANVETASLAARHPELKAAITEAKFVVADGMPLVWASRLSGQRLPGRVTGSDLLPALSALAAARGYRVYLLGGAPGVGQQAAERLRQRHPGFDVVGIESPPYRELTAEESRAILERVRAARAQLLILSFNQLRAETWIHAHHAQLTGTLCVNVGAALDFEAGRVPRAPRWMQRVGLEWFYRMAREPGRLTSRYFKNFLFILRMSAMDLVRARPRAAS